MAPIPILSFLVCSTTSPHDILKVSRKIIDHNLPIGWVKADIVNPGEFTYMNFMGFWLGLMLKVLCAGVESNILLMILYVINAVIHWYVLSSF
jgi:hypothetical protein